MEMIQLTKEMPGAKFRLFFQQKIALKSLTWNLKWWFHMVSKFGISFPRGWFSDSMLNFGGVFTPIVLHPAFLMFGNKIGQKMAEVRVPMIFGMEEGRDDFWTFWRNLKDLAATSIHFLAATPCATPKLPTIVAWICWTPTLTTIARSPVEWDPFPFRYGGWSQFLHVPVLKIHWKYQSLSNFEGWLLESNNLLTFDINCCQ